MKLKQRTIYYQDELHDEFAGDHIKAKHIGQDYRYIRVRPLERMLHGFWYGIRVVFDCMYSNCNYSISKRTDTTDYKETDKDRTGISQASKY